MNDQLIGSRITGTSVPALNTNLIFRIQLNDADEPAANYRVEVFSGTVGGAVADAVRIATREGNGEILINDVPYTGGQQYFYFKIIQTNDDDAEDRVWTAPVWFEPNAITEPPIIPAMLTLSVDRVGEVATITNTGGQAISLAGFTLRSVKGDQRFTFSGGPAITLQPNGTIRVRSGP